MLDSVSVSTSVVSGAPVHVVRVVLDGMHLLLTPHPPHTPPMGRREGPPAGCHSVCVLDMEWFELTLKHCNNALLSKDFQQVCIIQCMLLVLELLKNVLCIIAVCKDA